MKKNLTELNEEIDISTIIVGDFNTFSNSQNYQTENKDTVSGQHQQPPYLFDIYRKIYPTTANYTFFQMHNGSITKIGHSGPSNKSQFSKIEITLKVFFGYNGITTHFSITPGQRRNHKENQKIFLTEDNENIISTFVGYN